MSNHGVVKSVWVQDAGTLRVWSGCNCEGRLIYAQGPDNPPDKTVTYLTHRVEGMRGDILYMNVICFERDGNKLQKVSMSQQDARNVEICVTYDGVERRHAFSIGQEA